MGTQVNNRGRFLDVVPYAGGVRKVFSSDIAPCEIFPGSMGKLIDFLEIPLAGTFKVFGTITDCHKQWEDEVAFVTIDCDGVPVTLSKELRLRGTRMGGCALEDCPVVTLTYQVGTNDWRGSMPLQNGTLQLRIYCTYDPINLIVVMVCEWSGCGTTNSSSMVAICSYPLEWRVITAFNTGTPGPNSDALYCCDAPNAFAVWMVQDKITPVFNARQVDVVQDTKVFATAEGCDEDCPPTPGCCLEYVIDGNLLFTFHDWTVTSGSADCFCDHVPFRLPDTPPPGSGPDKCALVTFVECNTQMMFCLTCDSAQSIYDGQNGCGYYRLGVGTDPNRVYYEPTTCSCDPLSLTFCNIPWAMQKNDPAIYGYCQGTVCITVTYVPV